MRIIKILQYFAVILNIDVPSIKGIRSTSPLQTPRRFVHNFSVHLFNIISRTTRLTKDVYSNTSICNNILKEIYSHDKGPYKCCGLDIYQPNKQTCCLKTSSEYTVYENKPERNHICCGLRVYARRSPEPSCQHVSRNEAFLSSKLPKLETNYLDHSITKDLICNRTYAFFVRFIKEKKVKGKRFLVATITQYRRQMDAPALTRRVRRKVPLDQYSPKRLKRKGFVIFSDHEYFDDKDFVRRYGDTVFKAQKRKFVFLRRLRNVYDTCKA